MIALPVWTKYRALIPLVLGLCVTGFFFLPWMAPPMQQQPDGYEVGVPFANMHPPYIYHQDVTWSGWDLTKAPQNLYTMHIEQDVSDTDHFLVWSTTHTLSPLLICIPVFLFMYIYYAPISFLKKYLVFINTILLVLAIVGIMSMGCKASLSLNNRLYANTTFFYASKLLYGAYTTSILLIWMVVIQFHILKRQQRQPMQADGAGTHSPLGL